MKTARIAPPFSQVAARLGEFWQTGAAGLLRLETPTGQVWLGVKKGVLVWVDSTRPGLSFGAYLGEKGSIDPATIDALEAEHGAEGLGRALVEAGHLSRVELVTCYLELARARFLDGFRAPSVEIHLEPSLPETYLPVYLPLPAAVLGAVTRTHDLARLRSLLQIEAGTRVRLLPSSRLAAFELDATSSLARVLPHLRKDATIDTLSGATGLDEAKLLAFLFTLWCFAQVEIVTVAETSSEAGGQSSPAPTPTRPPRPSPPPRPPAPAAAPPRPKAPSAARAAPPPAPPATAAPDVPEEIAAALRRGRKSLFQLLEVSIKADASEISRAHDRLVQTLRLDDPSPDWTPDHTRAAAELLERVAVASLVLRDRERRRLHLEDISVGASQTDPAADPHVIEQVALALAQRHRSRGHLSIAENRLRKAVAQVPGSAALLSALGSVILEGAAGSDRRFAEAAALLQQAAKLAPGEAVPFAHLATIAVHHGDLTRARKLYRKALSLDPGCRPAKAGLIALGDEP